MERGFLAVVGVLYLLLAAWCALAPDRTSKTIGYELQPGTGQSEYLTIYGGLQLALGIAFLWPLYRPEDTSTVLLFCTAAHGFPALFRAISLFAFSGFSSTIYILAGTEWAIFLISAGMIFLKNKPS